MLEATKNDRSLVADILLQSFKDNQSVSYIVKKDKKYPDRLRYLMEYSFDVCFHFGKVFLSDDKRACALISFPNRKKPFLRATILDLKLILNTVGLANISKTLEREKRIKEEYPTHDFYYLWFIGVIPAQQGKGIGSALIDDIINLANTQQQDIYLETSTLRNLPWYKKRGFCIYREIDFGYKLFCLKNN